MNVFAPPQRPSRKTLVLSLLGLAAFLAVEALLLRHYIRTDARPPSWEQATQLQLALDYREAPAAGLGGFLTMKPKPGMPPYPPAYPWLLSGSAEPARAALWFNWAYMALLAVSLFAISWRFLPDARALAATLAFCASPGLQDLLTSRLVDLSLVALVAAGYWALLEADGFTVWLPSILFGVVFAAGMLHKWSYLAFMVPAYVIFFRALGDRRARLPLLAATALSAALFLPWYWSHLTLLPAWLARSWAAGGPSFWKGGAWAEYLIQANGALGPLLWALGFISLLAPQYARRRENAWMIAYWVVFSYVIWTVVPDRQIRFLLPGLAPLGLAMAATWPPAVSWTVTAFQLLCALNFFFGFVGPLKLATPLVPMTFLENHPPLKADWKIEDILRRVETARDPSRPITAVAFVADDESFNAPAFRWMQRRLRLPHTQLRGVNKRLCELSEFLLLKSGKPAPGGKAEALEKAAKAVMDPDGWFQNSYQIVQNWSLPDGTTAELYRQRSMRRRPAGGRKLSYMFFEAGKTQVRGLNLDMGAWDPRNSAFPLVMLSADRVDSQGLSLRGVTADLENFSFVPLYEGGLGDYAWDDIRLMRLDRVVVRSLQVDAADVKKYVEKRVPGLQLGGLTLDGTVKASGVWKGRPVAVEASLELDREARRLRLRVLSASYMGISIPPAFFAPIRALDLSLAATPERPFDVELPGLTIRGDRLTVP